MKKIFFCILLFIFCVGIIFRVFSYGNEYTKKFDSKYWERRFTESQWADPRSKNPIGDDGLFTYAGWKYIHGENPTYFVPGYPPLGLYLIGLFTIIFQNQNIFALIVGLLVLGVFYILNIELFKDRFIAFIPVLLFSYEPLFFEQLRAPYLDLLHLLFLLLTFSFFLKKKYILSSIFLGCFVSTKFAFLGVLPLLSMILFLLIKSRKSTKPFLITLPLAAAVYIAMYIRFFILGNSFISFLGIHKWIIHYYNIGAKGVFGAVFPMLFSGIWYTWFSSPQHVSEWLPTWPFIFVLTLLYGVILIKKKKIDSSVLLFLWVIFYLAFLSVTPIFSRYLLLLIPFLYNLSVWVFVKVLDLHGFYAIRTSKKS